MHASYFDECRIRARVATAARWPGQKLEAGCASLRSVKINGPPYKGAAAERGLLSSEVRMSMIEIRFARDLSENWLKMPAIRSKVPLSMCEKLRKLHKNCAIRLELCRSVTV
jgi:hypothetical protein